MSAWPTTYADIVAARERLRPHRTPTPLRSYPVLDEAVGGGIRVLSGANIDAETLRRVLAKEL